MNNDNKAIYQPQLIVSDEYLFTFYNCWWCEGWRFIGFQVLQVMRVCVCGRTYLYMSDSLCPGD